MRDGALLSFWWQNNLCMQLFLHLLNCLYLDHTFNLQILSPISLLLCELSTVCSFLQASRWYGMGSFTSCCMHTCSNRISQGLQEDSLSHHALHDRLLRSLEHLLPLFCPDPGVYRTVSCFSLTSHSLNTPSLRCHALGCGAQSCPVVDGLEINGTFPCVCPVPDPSHTCIL